MTHQKWMLECSESHTLKKRAISRLNILAPCPLQSIRCRLSVSLLVFPGNYRGKAPKPLSLQPAPPNLQTGLSCFGVFSDLFLGCLVFCRLGNCKDKRRPYLPIGGGSKAFSPKTGLFFAVKGASPRPRIPKFPVDTPAPPPSPKRGGGGFYWTSQEGAGALPGEGGGEVSGNFAGAECSKSSLPLKH